MIEVKGIRKSFGDKDVLKSVSTFFEPAQCSLIIGASGSGKTVMMKCLVGLMHPDEGHILYNGDTDITTLEKHELKLLRQQVGMLFQGSALFDSLTVEQNVLFPLNMFSNKSKAEKKARVNECLERVNLANANKLFPAELSGGMKKRVGIARAIVMNPKYLFCDEPNSGLDPQTSIVIDKLIQEITADYKITTVINTHDMSSVMGMGDKVVFIYKGEKQWEGSNREILKANNQLLNDFIFASEFLKAVKPSLERS
jgi:phospholipid/cholesterol/gamma-HCH transport system ATP-binding protein